MQSGWQGAHLCQKLHLVHLVPCGLINVPRLRIPAVAVFWSLRPVSVRYMRSITELKSILWLVSVHRSSWSFKMFTGGGTCYCSSGWTQVKWALWFVRLGQSRTKFPTSLHSKHSALEGDGLVRLTWPNDLFGAKRVVEFLVAVVAVLSVVHAQSCSCGDHQRRPPTLSAGNLSMRPSLLPSLLASVSWLLSTAKDSRSCFSSACWIASPCLATNASRLSSRFAKVPIDVCRAANISSTWPCELGKLALTTLSYCQSL